MSIERKSALVVVDFQNDFLAVDERNPFGGRLPVPGATNILPIINRTIALFRNKGLPVVFTRDFHPRKTTHFLEFGGVWPEHCVQGTEGAAFHRDLNLGENPVIVSKGMGENEDAYSGFQGIVDGKGQTLAEFLRSLNVSDLYVSGIATDYCSGNTALGGLENGFRTFFVKDTSEAVNLKPDDGRKMLERMRAAGVRLVLANELERLI